MNTDKLTALTAEVNELLDRRNQLLQKRDATQDPNEAEVLGASIARTDTELPALRKRVHDTLNATKDNSERKRLKKLERRIDRVLSGVEIERESDISMKYEEELRQALRQAKTNSERLRINKKLRQLRDPSRPPNGRSEAMPGRHDDCVLQTAIGLACIEGATAFVQPITVTALPPDLARLEREEEANAILGMAMRW
jgi:hypothetical protein